MQTLRCASISILSLTLPLALIGAASAQGGPKPEMLVQGVQAGKTMFEPGDTGRGGNGQPVDGIEALSREMLKVHIHAHLALFYKGERVAVPYGIGIVGPFRAENGFVGSGKAIYWLHTHDATGIIHVESPDDRKYTLGNFFNIWGQPLGENEVAGMKGRVRAYVDGKLQFGSPREIVLASHRLITLEVGDPAVPPPVYTFPQGL